MSDTLLEGHTVGQRFYSYFFLSSVEYSNNNANLIYIFYYHYVSQKKGPSLRSIISL